MSEDLYVAETNIPSLKFIDYPVDIYFRIYPSGARYELEIRAVGQLLRVPIDLSISDLAKINEMLQAAFSNVIRNNDESIEEDINKESLIRLAEAGNYAFRRIFSNNEALSAVNDIFLLSKNITIEIASENFFLPWELLYPENLLDDISYQNFWGMNCVISRIIVRNKRQVAFVSPIIHTKSAPSLGLLTYDRLPTVLAREKPFFERLANEGRLQLFHLQSLNVDQKPKEWLVFQDFWRKNLDFAHFACHAFYEDGSPDKSHILLSDNFPISLVDMEVYGISMSSSPLIIMNACETGNLNPLYTSYFADALLQRGARGVVATECAVPDEFAADFAEQLYHHLFRGQELGVSLLTVRKYFLDKYQNPTGLLYSMYAPSAIRLHRK